MNASAGFTIEYVWLSSRPQIPKEEPHDDIVIDVRSYKYEIRPVKRAENVELAMISE